MLLSFTEYKQQHFDSVLNEAQFTYDEVKYLERVLKDMIDGKPIKFYPKKGSPAVVEKVKVTPELKAAYALAKTGDLYAAMDAIRNPGTKTPIFHTSKGSYRWTQIYKGTWSKPKDKGSTTDAANINEFLSVYFFPNPGYTSPEDFVADLRTKSASKATGVLRDNKPFKYGEMVEMIDAAGEDAAINIELGYQNYLAIKEDLRKNFYNKKPEVFYWTPRTKPNGVYSKHPADVVVEFDDGSMIGYSNKKVVGDKENTPKINSSVTKLFDEFIPGGAKVATRFIQQAAKNTLHHPLVQKLPKPLYELIAKKFLKLKVSSSAAHREFNDIDKAFKLADAPIYFKTPSKPDRDKDAKGGVAFYHIYREELIKQIEKHLADKKVFVGFLQAYNKRMFPTKGRHLPYKMLIARPRKKSEIVPMNDNEALRMALEDKNPDHIRVTHKPGQQSIQVEWRPSTGKVCSTKIDVRTRAKGGWSGTDLSMQGYKIYIK